MINIRNLLKIRHLSCCYIFILLGGMVVVSLNILIAFHRIYQIFQLVLLLWSWCPSLLPQTFLVLCYNKNEKFL